MLNIAKYQIKNIFKTLNLNKIIIFVLFISLIAGQLIKIPSGNYGGATLLDFTIVVIGLASLFVLKKIREFPFYITSGFIFTFLCLSSLFFTPLDLTTDQYLISLAYTLRLVVFLLMGTFLYFSANVLKKKVPEAILYSGISLSILGFIQLILFPNLNFLEEYSWDPHFLRNVSTFLDPNFLGGFLVLSLILFFYNSTLKKNLKVLFFSVIFVGLLLTFSRSGYIMFFVSFFTLSVFKKSLKLFFITFILSCLLLVGNFFYNSIIAPPLNIDRQVSANYRIMSWQTGIEIFEKSPLFGIGFNSYRYALDEYDLIPQKFIEGRAATGNDSSLIFILATTGIAGLISYVTFFICLLIYAIKSMWSGNQFGVLLLSGITGLLFQSFFINSLFYPVYLLWIFSLAAVSKIKSR